MTPIKVLLIDDHALFRDGVALVLARGLAEVELVHAQRADQALGLLAEQDDFDVILLDLGLPDRDGFEALAALRQTAPASPVVVVSASNRHDDVVHAIRLGAQGYIPKASSGELMLSALRVVFAGGVYLPPEALAADVAGAGAGHEAAEMAPTTRAAPADNLGLSERQLDVLRLLIQGDSNKRIGNKLGISERTVRVHVGAIFKALDAGNRTEASFKASQLLGDWINSP